MYPNPQDVPPLPPRPNVEQCNELAKDLVKACESDAPDAFREWAARWPDQAQQIERFARDTLASRTCALTGAQFVMARLYGFESWPTFAAHLDGLARAASPVSRFEAAAEAIVSGDVATVRQLLREEPALIHERSTRAHRATLLHYVAANGVESYRQTTPANAVEIAGILLAAGAEVDAEADVYGGGCTTLGLAATSIHPERAGVQNALMQILIDHGAVVDRPGGVGRTHLFVIGCLANGRGPAAEYLAGRGARLDLEGAAGVGRLDVVASSFDPDGNLKPTATREQMQAGFTWACEFGRIAIVEFLLDRGMPIDATLRHDGQTGLHWAALGGHADIVTLLLERGASVHAVDHSYNGTPLTWALHGWMGRAAGIERNGYYDVVARLVRAGAAVNLQWFEDDPDRRPFTVALHADTRMIAALRAGGT